MRKTGLLLALLLAVLVLPAQQQVKIKKRDYKRDIALETNHGTIILRLAKETPLHRDNFIRLVKSKYFDGILFHRVIDSFMIQAGDPNSRGAAAGKSLGNGEPGYTIPAEIVPELFHKKGALGAARQGDNVNPEKASSGSQFYIVKGKPFTEEALASVEEKRLQGVKLPDAHRTYYKTTGGTPHLDRNYTVFGEVVNGQEIVDGISAVETSKGADRDRPLNDVIIIKAKLVKKVK